MTGETMLELTTDTTIDIDDTHYRVELDESAKDPNGKVLTYDVRVICTPRPGVTFEVMYADLPAVELSAHSLAQLIKQDVHPKVAR